MKFYFFQQNVICCNYSLFCPQICLKWPSRAPSSCPLSLFHWQSFAGYYLLAWGNVDSFMHFQCSESRCSPITPGSFSWSVFFRHYTRSIVTVELYRSPVLAVMAFMLVFCFSGFVNSFYHMLSKSSGDSRSSAIFISRLGTAVDLQFKSAQVLLFNIIKIIKDKEKYFHNKVFKKKSGSTRWFHLGKGTCHQNWLPEFYPLNPYGGRKNPALANCPLTFTPDTYIMTYADYPSTIN